MAELGGPGVLGGYDLDSFGLQAGGRSSTTIKPKSAADLQVAAKAM